MNSLNMDLHGKVVVLEKKYMRLEYQDVKSRLFRCEHGFGCSSFTDGTALVGIFLADGETARMEGYMVERLAEPGEIEQVISSSKKI